MKKLGFALTLALLLPAVARAAENTTWLTDLAKAQTTAKEEKKLVLLDFTGSDWCPPCKMLHRTVFTSKEFENLAKDKFVLVLVDFPRTHALPAEQKQKNEDLAAKYSVEAFPTVIVLDANGKQALREEGYNGDSKDYLGKLQKVSAHAEHSTVTK